MLALETEVDDVAIHGVDIVRLDEAGKSVEFKVMLPPLTATPGHPGVHGGAAGGGGKSLALVPEIELLQ